MFVVFVAGPLLGLIVQPLIGTSSVPLSLFQGLSGLQGS